LQKPCINSYFYTRFWNRTYTLFQNRVKAKTTVNKSPFGTSNGVDIQNIIVGFQNVFVCLARCIWWCIIVGVRKGFLADEKLFFKSPLILIYLLFISMFVYFLFQEVRSHILRKRQRAERKERNRRASPFSFFKTHL